MPLIRGIARTAVVAGTASAVAGRVNRRQQQRWGAQDQQAAESQQYEQQQQYAQAPPQQYAPPPQQYAPPPQQYAAAPAEASDSSYLEELTQLGQLHTDGVLSDEEFAAQKAKILRR